MVTADTKPPPLPDSPPSYDSLISFPFSTPVPGTSTAGGSSGTGELRGAAKHIQHLFTSPPNAETLLGCGSAPYGQVAGIETHKKWGRNVTFDPRLQDPAVLFDWIRAQSLVPPKIRLRCLGAHFEIPERDEVVQDNGITRHRRKGQTERVVDFDFFIDVMPVFDHPENLANIHLCTVRPQTPTHRGTHRLTYGASYAPALPRHERGSAPGSLYQPLPGSVMPASGELVTDVGRAQTRTEKRRFNLEEMNKWRFSKGLPIWADVAGMKEYREDRGAKGRKGKRVQRGTGPTSGEIVLSDAEEGRSGEEEAVVEGNGTVIDARGIRFADQPALKEWCEAYCNDKGLLKEFVLRKWIWGWEMDALESAVKSAIISTGYQSNELKVEWEIEDAVVYVRPPNLVSRIVWDTPPVLMIFAILFYPLIWVWQRLHSGGGAPYDLARASYALKYYPPLPSTYPAESVAQAEARLPGLYKLHPELPQNPPLQPGPKGVHYLLGRKEGGWFREWEERVRMGVRMRYRGELVGTTVGDARPPSLDGY